MTLFRWRALCDCPTLPVSFFKKQLSSSENSSGVSVNRCHQRPLGLIQMRRHLHVLCVRHSTGHCYPVRVDKWRKSMNGFLVSTAAGVAASADLFSISSPLVTSNDGVST